MSVIFPKGGFVTHLHHSFVYEYKPKDPIFSIVLRVHRSTV